MIKDLGGILISVIPSYSVLFQARLISVHSWLAIKKILKYIIYMFVVCPTIT